MRYLDIDKATKISKIGLGTWQFGSREWGYGQPYAEQGARAIVRRALELGVTLFDTAEIYGFGRSERILGEALGTDLDSVFLATKLFPLVPVSPVVEQRAVASANRLGASRLDLYQVHQPNPVVRDGTLMRGMRARERAGDLIATLREVASAHSVTPAQIALAWVIRHPAVTAIPGASSVEQLESNVAAADIDLTDEQYEALGAASARFRPIGGPAALAGL